MVFFISTRQEEEIKKRIKKTAKDKTVKRMNQKAVQEEKRGIKRITETEARCRRDADVIYKIFFS